MFIHEKDNWTDFKWNDSQIAAVMAEANRSVGYLNGRLSSIGFDRVQLTSLETLTNDVVSSSAIEGIQLNADEVRSSVARKLGIEIKEEKEPTHYVDGVVEMMMDAVYRYDSPLTEERLFNWHCALFPNGRSGNSPIRVGQYRNEPMEVVSGSFGRKRVHYRAVAPENVASEMQKFIEWFNNPTVIPSITKSAIAHLWFVSIHPFDDGNGRIARALSDMVLSQMEKSALRFYSLSTEINQEKRAYYRVLERTQRGDGDITEWLSWYYKCLIQSVETANKKLSNVLNKSVFWTIHAGVTMNSRQVKILNFFLDGYDAKITQKNWAKYAAVSADVALDDLNDLVSKGVLVEQKGRTRDASYSIVYVKNEKYFSNVSISDSCGKHFISVVYQEKKYVELLSDLDYQRLVNEEISENDLSYKYFAYLLD